MSSDCSTTLIGKTIFRKKIIICRFSALASFFPSPSQRHWTTFRVRIINHVRLHTYGRIMNHVRKCESENGAAVVCVSKVNGRNRVLPSESFRRSVRRSLPAVLFGEVYRSRKRVVRRSVLLGELCCSQKCCRRNVVAEMLSQKCCRKNISTVG